MSLVYLNGALVPEHEARVGVLDAGLQHGVGLFETMRTYLGRFFRLGEHLQRLIGSAAALGLPTPGTADELEAAVRRTVADNGLSDARVRLTATRGRLSEAGDGTPTVIVTAVPLSAYPAELYQRGMSVAVADIRQNETDPTCRHKTLLYFPRLLALEAARKKGCGEALFFNTQKHLAEGAISNVFLVCGGELLTPSLETGILPGITRRAVLECAGAEGIRTIEKTLTIHDLLGASEVFLTNSIMEIMPVSQVERHRVGDGRPGQRTRRLSDRLRALIEQQAG
jgi:D-amino acid aminotransferase